MPSGGVGRIARLMALALRFEELVRTGAVANRAELARLGQVNSAPISQITNLLHLAPDIQECRRHLRLKSAVLFCRYCGAADVFCQFHGSPAPSEVRPRLGVFSCADHCLAGSNFSLAFPVPLASNGNFKLLFGPYRSPRCRVGRTWLRCAIRGQVKVELRWSRSPAPFVEGVTSYEQ
jgi:hypothetical protein